MLVRSRAHALLIAITVPASWMLASVGNGQDLQQQDAVALIVKTANEICQSAPLEATTQGTTLSGDASAKLGGLVGKLADLGVSGTGQYQTSRSMGVLQKDLATAIQSGNDCKLEVFRKLMKVLLSPPPVPPPVPAAQVPAAQVPAAQVPKQIPGESVLCGNLVRYVINATAEDKRYTSFLGVWAGAAWNSRTCGGLVVEEIRNNGAARVRYIYGPMPNRSGRWRIQVPDDAKIENGRLSFTDEEGGAFVFSLAGPNRLVGQFISVDDVQMRANFNKEPLLIQ